MMRRSVCFPPSCGAFCPGCEVCCDLVVDGEHQPTVAFRSSSVCVDGARRPDGDVPPGSNAVQRRGGRTDPTPREAPIGTTGLLDDGTCKPAERSETRLLQRRPCAACGRWPGKSCRGNVICDCDLCFQAHTSTGCTRNCAAARRAKCKSRKLRCAALCCTGRLACCERSLSPRRCDCRHARHSRQCTKWC